MEKMTDFQFKKLLAMVSEILKSSKDLEDAQKKIDELRKDEK